MRGYDTMTGAKCNILFYHVKKSQEKYNCGKYIINYTNIHEKDYN